MTTRKASLELQAPGSEEDGAEQVLAPDWDPFSLDRSTSLFNESFSEMLNGFSLPENSHILAAACPKSPQPSKQNGSTNQRKRKANYAGVKHAKIEGLDASSNTAKRRAMEDAKEEGVHVRAKRGHATSSHSLAERVESYASLHKPSTSLIPLFCAKYSIFYLQIRRERISERMKFLQDLVPGCNKITGKAVMLDEIIHYVRSLQGQVEFLAMKLASVHPDLNMDIDQIPSKEILLSRYQTQTIPWYNAGINPSNADLMQPGVVIPITTSQGELLRTNLYQTPNKSQMDFFSYPFLRN